jgi:hypothetical protein
MHRHGEWPSLRVEPISATFRGRFGTPPDDVLDAREDGGCIPLVTTAAPPVETAGRSEGDVRLGCVSL